MAVVSTQAPSKQFHALPKEIGVLGRKEHVRPERDEVIDGRERHLEVFDILPEVEKKKEKERERHQGVIRKTTTWTTCGKRIFRV